MCKSAIGERFLKPGDSGSLVLLNDPSGLQGTVIGIGCGGNTSNGLSYMIPIDLVVKGIEEVTQGRVVNPVYGGVATGYQTLV